MLINHIVLQQVHRKKGEVVKKGEMEEVVKKEEMKDAAKEYQFLDQTELPHIFVSTYQFHLLSSLYSSLSYLTLALSNVHHSLIEIYVVLLLSVFFGQHLFDSPMTSYHSITDPVSLQLEQITFTLLKSLKKQQNIRIVELRWIRCSKH